MQEMRPYEPASMQYDDWTGTVAGDDVDMRMFEDLLEVEKQSGGFFTFTCSFSEGTNQLTPTE
jgi:hypothetical protein